MSKVGMNPNTYALPNDSTAVEEDGDEIFTIMPKECTGWKCQVGGKNRTLENINGFMVCPACGGSYGEA